LGHAQKWLKLSVYLSFLAISFYIPFDTNPQYSSIKYMIA
jgi:hypothetical protein